MVPGTAGGDGWSFDPVERRFRVLMNAHTAARYVAARYGPLDSGYVTALGRIRERHDRILTRLRLYAHVSLELGEPPGRAVVDYCDAVGDALASMHELVRARSW